VGLLEVCPNLLDLCTQRLVFLRQDRDLRLDAFELVSEAGEEGANLAWVDATEPDGEIFSTYVVWISSGTP
jgi:hypothetical protein